MDTPWAKWTKSQWFCRVGRRDPDRWTQPRAEGPPEVRPVASADAILIDGHFDIGLRRAEVCGVASADAILIDGHRLTIAYCLLPIAVASADAILIDGHFDQAAVRKAVGPSRRPTRS